jgi:hypothetical protein
MKGSKSEFEERKRKPQLRWRTTSRMRRRWRRSQRPAQKRSSGTQVFQLTPIPQPHTWHQRMRLKLEQINRHQDLRFYACGAIQAERQGVAVRASPRTPLPPREKAETVDLTLPAKPALDWSIPRVKARTLMVLLSDDSPR